MACLFLKADFERLKDSLRALEGKIRHNARDIGESVTQSSESWHDNYTFEHAQREHSRLSQELARLRAILADAEVVNRDSGHTEVGVGSTVTLVNTASGDRQVVTIGSYLAAPGSISYASPLGKALMGLHAGETCSLQIDSQKTTWKLESIS